MEIVRGTTPTIVITVKNEMDLTTIQEVWVYTAQQNKVKIDKLYQDVTIEVRARRYAQTQSKPRRFISDKNVTHRRYCIGYYCHRS